MRYLLIHQNFPGQFKHLFSALARAPANIVIGIGDASCLKDKPRQAFPPNAQIMAYSSPPTAREQTHPYLRGVEVQTRRGQQVARLLLELKNKGFTPDVILGHPGWGEMLFVRDIFPTARIISFCEFYYQAHGADVGFDPEFPSTLDDQCRIRLRNTVLQQALLECDAGIAPTEWQKSTHPNDLQHKISVIHDGIDTDFIAPDPESKFVLSDGRTLTRQDQVVTFVNRNLEPYRGFHVFMRTLPELMAQNPRAHFIVTGGDDVSYGRAPPEGSYRQLYMAQFADRLDPSRLHFTGKLAYTDYLRLLQISSAHIYLTYPFVLSWSMLEAMSAGCLLIGSRTTPVTEVIHDGENGLLVDFFDQATLAATLHKVLQNPAAFSRLQQNARQTIVQHYDLRTVCLPRMLRTMGQ